MKIIFIASGLLSAVITFFIVYTLKMTSVIEMIELWGGISLGSAVVIFLLIMTKGSTTWRHSNFDKKGYSEFRKW